MKTFLKNLTVVLLASALLWAVNPWRACPYDGEEANFTGARRDKDCEYRHIHMVPGKDPVEHRFWVSCGD